jgi:hypothetical protein
MQRSTVCCRRRVSSALALPSHHVTGKPVWSTYSCRFTGVVLQQPAKPFATKEDIERMNWLRVL